jgi:hypothetical protein
MSEVIGLGSLIGFVLSLIVFLVFIGMIIRLGDIRDELMKIRKSLTPESEKPKQPKNYLQLLPEFCAELCPNAVNC